MKDMKNLYIVLDTETFNYSKVPFDISWLGMDKKGNILFRRSYLVREVYLTRKGTVSPDIKCGIFSQDKYKHYEELREAGKIEVKSMIEIREQFMKDCSTGLNTTVCAYNCAFDKEALENAMYRTGYDIPFTYFEWHDIWGLAEKLIMDTNKYMEFVVENSYYTEKPNGKTNAETAYRYLTNNTGFIETHVAQDDIEIEAFILAKCFETHKKIEWVTGHYAIPQKRFRKILAKAQQV